MYGNRSYTYFYTKLATYFGQSKIDILKLPCIVPYRGKLWWQENLANSVHSQKHKIMQRNSSIIFKTRKCGEHISCYEVLNVNAIAVCMGLCDRVKLDLAIAIGAQGTQQVHIVYEMRRD